MKQFDIHMSNGVFKVGTDATLLGAWIPLFSPKRILDIGTGTGVVALMLAQRTEAHIDAIDINPEASTLANHNFSLSTFAHRLNSYTGDISEYKPKSTYDHICINPPYYQQGSEPHNKSLITAKYADSMKMQDILEFCKLYLRNEGHLSMVYPPYYGSTFVEKAASHNLYLYQRIAVHDKEGSSVSRWVDTFRQGNTAPTYYSKVVLYDAQRKFSEESKAKLKDFLTIF